eukprot:scaffold1357_cov36-Phaeocystis_antarctica.AAC.1
MAASALATCLASASLASTAAASRWRAAAASRSSLAFCVVPLQLDFLERRGGRAHRGLASLQCGGRRGRGRLWRRCVLPDKLRGGRMALEISQQQGRATLLGAQLGVGLGSQQGLRARLLPPVSGPYQGSVAFAGLQVRNGRVHQQDEQDGEVAVARSSHERGEAEAGLQVDARASLQ